PASHHPPHPAQPGLPAAQLEGAAERLRPAVRLRARPARHEPAVRRAAAALARERARRGGRRLTGLLATDPGRAARYVRSRACRLALLHEARDPGAQALRVEAERLADVHEREEPAPVAPPDPVPASPLALAAPAPPA